MGRVDLVEDFATRTLRKQVREAMQAHGEEIIALRMYHPVLDEPAQPRCPNCYDDVYKQGEFFDCTVCYGTTFKGGIKELARCWAILSSSPDEEERKKRGVYQRVPRSIMFESSVDLKQNDYFFRVRRWSKAHEPVEMGEAYVLDQVSEDDLHTGNQFKQTPQDVVGQKARISGLDPGHVIYRVVGREISPNVPILRSDGLRR